MAHYWHGHESLAEYLRARAHDADEQTRVSKRRVPRREVCRQPRFWNAVTQRDDVPGEICGRYATTVADDGTYRCPQHGQPPKRQ